jgi:Leucine-rich repeat (LRR) protein
MVTLNKKKLEYILKLKTYTTELKVTNEKIQTIEDDVFEDYSSNVERLDLSHNQIKCLKSKIFNSFDKLTKLILQSNKFEKIGDVFVKETPDDHDGFPIKGLNLCENLVSEIRQTDFKNLLFLTFLDLQNNKIEVIEDDSFSRLSSLETINISNNLIRKINKRTFQGLLNVKNIYLDNNKIDSISDDSFHGLSKLTWLRLNKNELKTISSLLFKGLKSLQSLNLQSASIKKIEDEAFADLHNLKVLIITNNELKNVTYKMLKGLTNLTELFIDSNEIESIDTDAFRDLIKLTNLYMYKNNITDVANIFQDLKKLEVLNCSSNKLEKINEKTFSGCTELQDIDLENNQIDAMEFKDLNKLKKLVISYNRNHSINSRCFSNLPSITEIILKYNKIERLETNAFKDLTSLVKIDLSFNKIKTIDPEAIGLYKDLVNIERIILSGNQIEKIDFITFIKLIRLDKKNISHLKNCKINDINFFPEGLEKLNQDLVDELVKFSFENNLSKYFCVGLMLKMGLYLDDLRGSDAHKQILEYIFAVKFSESSDFKGFTEFIDFIRVDDPKNVFVDDVKQFILKYLTESLDEDIYYKTLMHSESEIFNVLTEFGLKFTNEILINYLKIKRYSKFEDLLTQFLFLNKQPIKSNSYFIILNSLFWTEGTNNFPQTIFDYLVSTEISFKKYSQSYLLDLLFTLNGVYFNSTLSSEYLNLSPEIKASQKFNDYDIFKTLIFTFNQKTCLIHSIATLNFNNNILNYLLKNKKQLKLISDGCHEEFGKEEDDDDDETPLEKILNETKISNNVVKNIVDKYLTLTVEERNPFKLSSESFKSLVRRNQSYLLKTILDNTDILQTNDMQILRFERFKKSLRECVNECFTIAIDNNNERIVEFLIDKLISLKINDFHSKLVNYETIRKLFEKKWWIEIEKLLDSFCVQPPNARYRLKSINRLKKIKILMNNEASTNDEEDLEISNLYKSPDENDEDEFTNHMVKKEVYNFISLDNSDDDDDIFGDQPNKEHFLMLVARSGQTNLIQHRLVLKLITLKWRYIPRTIYHSLTSMHLVFLITFLLYVLSEFDLRHQGIVDSTSTHTYESNNSNSTLLNEKKLLVLESNFSLILTAILLAFFLFYEICQIYAEKLAYFFSIKNWLEFITYGSSLVIIFIIKFENLQEITGLFGSMSILFGFIVLILRLEKNSNFGAYVVAFRRSFVNTVRTLPFILLLFVGFIFSFKIRSRNGVKIFSTNGNYMSMARLINMFIGSYNLEEMGLDGTGLLNEIVNFFYLFCISRFNDNNID